MTRLFRLERNPAFERKPNEDAELGLAWLEVVAIEPRQLVQNDENEQVRVIDNDYICRTEHGLMRIPARDIWDAIEHDELYEHDTPSEQRRKES